MTAPWLQYAACLCLSTVLEISTGCPSIWETSVESSLVSESNSSQETETVKLTIDFGERRPKRVIENIAWSEGMTVFEAMRQARRLDREFAFRHRGSRDTLFILAIDRVENQGACGDNWIFRVDDKLGDRSCGVYPVAAGQHIVWQFGDYKRD
jgi:hypothetical protein